VAARNRRDVADEIVVELFVERRVDRTLNRRQKERYPSAGELTTASMAMLPAPPGRFSTMKGWPSRSDSHCAIKRPIISGALPGAMPMIRRTGRVG
jgi:hypothetical protein